MRRVGDLHKPGAILLLIGAICVFALLAAIASSQETGGGCDAVLDSTEFVGDGLLTRKADAAPDSPGDMLVRCEAVRRLENRNELVADGPGRLLIWIDRDYLTKTIADTVAGDEEELLEISWSDRMRFIGRTTDAEGHPCSRVEFNGTVEAQLEHSLLHCAERMVIYTASPVPLGRVHNYWEGAAPKGPVRRPDARIAAIELKSDALAVTRSVERDGLSFICQQRYEALDKLAYDRRTGSVQIRGKGRVVLFEQSTDVPEAGHKATWPLCRTDISFSDGMMNRLDSRARQCSFYECAEYKGDVKLERVGVQAVTVDKPELSADVVFLAAPRVAHIIDVRARRGDLPNPHSHYVKAVGGTCTIAPSASMQSAEVLLKLPEGIAYGRGGGDTRPKSAGRPEKNDKAGASGHREVARFELRTGKFTTVDSSASTTLDELIAQQLRKLGSADRNGKRTPGTDAHK